MALSTMLYQDPFARSVFRFDPFRKVEKLMDHMLTDFDHEIGLIHNWTPDFWSLTNFEKDKDGNMNMSVDTRGFKPEELSVDVENGQLTVRGKHEQKENGKYVSRHFQRTVALPKEVNYEKVKCELNDRGQLNIFVPQYQPALKNSTENKVPIELKDEKAKI